MSDQPFESWAVLDLMGHLRRVGRVSEVEVFGGKLLRIDIPIEGGEDVTEFYGCSSVYSIRPVSEEVGRDLAKRQADPRPVKPVSYREEDMSALPFGSRPDPGGFHVEEADDEEISGY